MVERPGENLSVRRQCALLNLPRSGVYRPGPVTGADDLAMMRLIDELHLKWPFYGSRRMVFELNQAGHGINRKRVQRLMRVMGIEALVPRPGTSKAAPGHKIYPYLLRGVSITEPNHVWASDITYIPMAQGFLYLVAIIDWASRAVLAWRLSNTMDTGFCIAALDEALARHGTPKIFNTDQGAQFTSAAFTGRLEAASITISMDGRGRFMDNIFIERLWRSSACCDLFMNSGCAVIKSCQRKGNAMPDDDMKAELERLRSENAALKKGASDGIRMKVSEKGAVSVYGMGRFPVTLYKEQWLKLLNMSEEIRAFIAENEARLKAKD
jgi:putative transposase